MSPSRATTPCSSTAAISGSSMTWGRSTAPTSTVRGSSRRSWRRETRCRSASTSSRSTSADARARDRGRLERGGRGAGRRASGRARLRTILRMQRDEFLPLRVIRQELAAGRSPDATPAPARGGRDGMRVWRPSVSVRAATGALFSLDDVLDDTKAEADLVRELEEYGVIKGEVRGGVRYFDETEREIVAAVAELARYGVGGRNLRVFRSSADREANLLQQILAPALRSRNPQRRKEAVEALENLAAVATHLKHLLLVRDLRKIVR